LDYAASKLPAPKNKKDESLIGGAHPALSSYPTFHEDIRLVACDKALF
jgi:hypothetical protein